MLAAVPVVYIIRRGSGHDAPDETHGDVAGQVGRNHRTEGIDQCVHVHFSIEKPEERNIKKGRPIPRKGEPRPFPKSKLFKVFQIVIGVGADELAPEMFIGVDHGGGDRWFRLDGQRVSALVAEFGVLLVLLSTLRAGLHFFESTTMEAPPG